MKKFPIYYNMDYPDTTWKVFFGSVYINTIPRSNNTDNNEASLLTFRRLKRYCLYAPTTERSYLAY